MAREVIEIAYVELDGQELQTVVSLDVSVTDPGAETVKTMRRTRRPLGHKSGIPDIELTLEVKVTNPPEVDWHGYQRDRSLHLLVYEENDGGQRFRCPDCRVTEVSSKHGVDGESAYTVKLVPLDHAEEIA